MLGQLTTALTAIVLSIGTCILFFMIANVLVEKGLTSEGKVGLARTRRDVLRKNIQPWVFLAPALLFLIGYLVYPAIETFRLSFYGRAGKEFVGFSNYLWAIKDGEFRQSIFNNLMWLIIVPGACTFIGLLIAYLTDRLRWGQIARTFIFMPMAISFIGASIIWKFVYDFRGPDAEQIGLLNAVLMGLGVEPKAWITLPFWNNLFLMVILIWIQTGFAMVILGAAMRGVPEEVLEAATIEGANEFQMFFRIIIPQILDTIVVVWTTITILVLKVFDIVAAMTNGQWDTEVLANLMFDWMFRGGGDVGRGSTIAVIIMVAVIPIMYFNLKRARESEA